MTDESTPLGPTYNLSELLAARSTEPFAELIELLDACDGCEASEVDAWCEEHDVTTSLEPLWAQCRDPRLLLVVRGFAALTDSSENAWRRIAVSLCASARALAHALPPGEERPLRVLEAAEAWTRGECSIAHLRETYDENALDFVISEGYDDPTIYDGFDHELDVETGPLEESALDGHVHRVALRRLIEQSIRCVNGIAAHGDGGASVADLDPGLVPPVAMAMCDAAATAYFAHFLDLIPASRQASQQDRYRTVTGAAGTMMDGFEVKQPESFYAARARLADELRAQVRCPSLADLFAR